MPHCLYAMNFSNGKKYIGITESPEKRWSMHKASSRQNPPSQYVHRAMRKHGIENVTFQILVIGEKEYIRDLERKVIAAFDTRNPAVGYNIAPGGEVSPVAGVGHTDATKLKMSASQKKRIHTPEEIAKMAATLKGRVIGPEWRQQGGGRPQRCRPS